jgi:hypothetical protein
VFKLRPVKNSCEDGNEHSGSGRRDVLTEWQIRSKSLFHWVSWETSCNIIGQTLSRDIAPSVKRYWHQFIFSVVFRSLQNSSLTWYRQTGASRPNCTSLQTYNVEGGEVASPGSILSGVVDIVARNRFVLKTSSGSVLKDSNTTCLILKQRKYSL